MSSGDHRVGAALVASSAAILFLYFFVRPSVDIHTILVISAAWLYTMVWDIRLTLAYGSYIARHEQSFVLRYVHRRFPGPAGVLVGMIEAACVVLLPTAVTFEAYPGGSMAVAWLFAMLHIVAVSGNKEFVKHNRQS